MKPAFIFPCTRNYVHEARPLVRSLRKWHPDIPVYVTTVEREDHRVDMAHFEDIEHRHLSIIVAPEEGSEFRRIRTFRFKLALDLAGEHDALCLLDADMVLIKNIEKFFRIASSGVIVVCSDSTILRYEKQHFEEHHLDVPDDISVVHPFFSTVPMFINPHDERAAEFFRAVWENPTGNDLETPNRIAAAKGLGDCMVYVNSYQWTNIHHSMLKPETFARPSDDGLISYQGQHVYMIHGHWQDPRYYGGQLIEPMEKNYKSEDVVRAKHAIRAIKHVYDQYVAEGDAQWR